MPFPFKPLALFCLAAAAGVPAQAGPPTVLVFPPYFHSYGIQRATQAKLFLLMPFKTRFDDPQGIAVTKMRTRDDPSTEADDDEVTVYGVNSGRDEIIYNTSMYGLALWGKKGRGREEMNAPKGVACDEAGNVYICDTGNDRIVRLFNPKKRVRFVAHLGAGALRRPTHLALDGAGRLYVSDTGNDRVLIMDSLGRVLREIREAGKTPVKSPLGIAVNMRNERWRYYHHDYIFFLNDSGRQLVRLDLQDNTAKAVAPGKLTGAACAYDFLATDYYGNCYLTDGPRGAVDKYDIFLNYLTSFGTLGTGDRQFDHPRGICIWKRYGQTFVAEREGAQYYWVGTDFRNVRLARAGHPFGGLALTGEIFEASFLSLYLLSAAGDTLKTVFSKRKLFPKSFRVPFGRAGAFGAPSRLMAVFEPTYSSYTYFQKPVYLDLK